jgi:hypothetical protein
VSSRSLGEVAVAWHVPEMDLLRALRLLPHVKLVTKPVHVLLVFTYSKRLCKYLKDGMSLLLCSIGTVATN